MMSQCKFLHKISFFRINNDPPQSGSISVSGMTLMPLFTHKCVVDWSGSRAFFNGLLDRRYLTGLLLYPLPAVFRCKYNMLFAMSFCVTVCVIIFFAYFLPSWRSIVFAVRLFPILTPSRLFLFIA